MMHDVKKLNSSDRVDFLTCFHKVGAMLPAPEPTTAIRQNDIPAFLATYRITHYPVIVRTSRQVQGGGFGDQEKNPNTWTVYFLVDNQWAHIESARGHRREWGNLDRLESWLRDQGFRYFWVRNDIDPVAPSIPMPGPIGTNGPD